MFASNPSSPPGGTARDATFGRSSAASRTSTLRPFPQASRPKMLSFKICVMNCGRWKPISTPGLRGHGGAGVVQAGNAACLTPPPPISASPCRPAPTGRQRQCHQAAKLLTRCPQASGGDRPVRRRSAERRRRRDRERLAEIRQRLDQQMESRRREIWAADKEMIRLQDDLTARQRPIQRRRRPGARGPRPTKSLKDIEQAEAIVATRKQQLGDDPVLAARIRRFQLDIDGGLSRLEADRQAREGGYRRFGIRLHHRRRPVHQCAAGRSEGRGCRSGRPSRRHERSRGRRYTAAIAAQSPQANLKLKELQGRSAVLSANIEERTQELAGQSPKPQGPGPSAANFRAEQDHRFAALDERESREKRKPAAAFISSSTTPPVSAARAAANEARAQRQALQSLTSQLAAKGAELRGDEDHFKLETAQTATMATVAPRFPSALSRSRPSPRPIAAGSGRPFMSRPSAWCSACSS